MRFTVLGPLSVSAESGSIPLRANRTRLLLAMFLARPGHAVPVADLIEALWGDSPPASVKKTLPWHVHRLRQLLDERDRITRQGEGYALRTLPGELDADTFHDTCTRAQDAHDAGDREAARALLAEALELWQGPAFGDLADHPALRLHANRLDDQRLATVERRATIDLELGRHEELIPELSTLVETHGSREHLRAILVIALYRSGRRDDALHRCREGRRLLDDELGTEGTSRLRRLAEAIGDDDPERVVIDLPRAHPRTTRAPSPPPPLTTLPGETAAFTGRGAEIELIRTRLTATAPQRASIATITGIGGAGKSSLAIRLARLLAEDFPGGSLYVNLRGANPNLEPLHPGQALAQLLRDLGFPARVPDSEVDELAAAFRSAVAGKRLIIVLDDADDAAQVRPLLPGSATCATIITCRRTLTTFDGAVHCHLGAFPPAEGMELLGRLIGAPRVSREPAEADAIARLCGYLPLALRIAAAQLIADPDGSLADLVARLSVERRRLAELGDCDEAVRASFQASYRQLGDPQLARMFRLLGLFFGPDLPLTAAAALADLPESRTAELLDRLVDSGMAECHQPGRYRMHDLLRLFAREQVLAEEPESIRVTAIQRALDCYLASVRAAYSHRPEAVESRRLELPPHDLSRSGLSFDSHKSGHAWISDERDNLLAAARQAVDVADRGPGYVTALAAVLSPMLRTLGHRRERVALSELALPHGDGRDRLCRYLTRLDAADARAALGAPREAISHAEAATALAAEELPVFMLANALSLHGEIHRRLGEWEHSAQYLHRALDHAREAGHRDSESVIRIRLGLVHQARNRWQDSIEQFQTAAELAEADGHLRNQAIALGNLGYSLTEVGRPTEAVDRFTTALALDHQDSPEGTVLAADHRWGLGTALAVLGQPDRAREHRQRCMEILDRLGLVTTREKEHVETAANPSPPRIIG